MKYTLSVSPAHRGIEILNTARNGRLDSGGKLRRALHNNLNLIDK